VIVNVHWVSFPAASRDLHTTSVCPSGKALPEGGVQVTCG
jgi:hypothetical protein